MLTSTCIVLAGLPLSLLATIDVSHWKAAQPLTSQMLG